MKKTWLLLSIGVSLTLASCDASEEPKVFETYTVTIKNETGYYSANIPSSFTFLKNETPPGNLIKNDTFNAYARNEFVKPAKDRVKTEGKVLAVYYTDANGTTLYDPLKFTQKSDATLYVKLIDAKDPVVILGSTDDATKLQTNEFVDGSKDVQDRPSLFWRVKNSKGWILKYRLYVDTLSSPVNEVVFKEKNADGTPKKDDNGNDVVIPIKDTKATLETPLKAGKTYYWRVVAETLSKKEFSSGVFSFTVKK